MRFIKILSGVAFFVATQVQADPLVKVNLRFKALIVERTCTVAPDSRDVYVDLGKWATKDINNTGTKTRAIPFAIRLTDCTAQNVSVAFRGQSDASSNELLALSKESSAKNVAIEILDKEKKRLALDKFNTPEKVEANKSVQLNFFANYISTADQVLAGTANSTATFVIQYN